MANTTLDMFEYATDASAQAAYIPNEYGNDTYTKLLLHGDGADAATFIPDTADAGSGYGTESACVLMLHFDGADTATTTTDAATNKAVTFVSGAQIDTAISKFGGSSCLIGDSNDQISIATSTDFNFGTGDFTIDFQLYFDTFPTAGDYINLSDGTYNQRWRFFYFHEATKYLQMYIQGTAWTFNWTPSEDTWYHVAVVRNGDNVMCFVDGTQVGSTGTGAAAKNVSGSDPITFGNGGSGVTHFDDYRIVGKALWTTNFTAPTVSPSPKDVTCVGNAQIDTAQKEFGTGSILFDASGDELTLVNSADWNANGGAYTVDFWVRFADVTTQKTHGLVAAQSTNGWVIFFDVYGGVKDLYYQQDSANKFNYTWSAAAINTWYHIAFTFDGTNTKCFIDGTQVGSTFTTADWNNDGAILSIGSLGGTSGSLNGHIDELRISKGVARWTSNFTPPTSAHLYQNLNCYSESTIKQQGSYSMKVIADITGSLNDTLTRTIGSPIDISTKTAIEFDIYASRTGTNIQMQIHDSGGTTSTYNTAVSSANTWETKTWDISGITSANKDAIDQIIIKITNADGANTFYLDNMLASSEEGNPIFFGCAF